MHAISDTSNLGVRSIPLDNGPIVLKQRIPLYFFWI